MNTSKGKGSSKGFGSMDESKQRDISKKGGEAPQGGRNAGNVGKGETGRKSGESQ